MFRWIALISAAVLVVAVAGAIVSSQPSPRPAQQQAADKDKKEQPAQENNIALWDRWFPDSISLYTLFLVIFTGVLAFGGLIQLNLLGRAERIATDAAKAAEKAAKAAEAQAKITRDAMVIDQRPWVSADIQIVGDLVFKNGRFEIPFLITMKNTGKTPALQTKLDLQVIVRIAGPGHKFPEETLKEIADSSRTARMRKFGGLQGNPIFPNDTFPVGLTVSNPQELADDRAATGIAVVVCVTYNSTFEPEPHQTGFILDIIRPGGVGGMLPIKSEGGNVPRAELTLQRLDILGASFAN